MMKTLRKPKAAVEEQGVPFTLDELEACLGREFLLTFYGEKKPLLDSKGQICEIVSHSPGRIDMFYLGEVSQANDALGRPYLPERSEFRVLKLEQLVRYPGYAPMLIGNTKVIRHGDKSSLDGGELQVYMAGNPTEKVRRALTCCCGECNMVPASPGNRTSSIPFGLKELEASVGEFYRVIGFAQNEIQKVGDYTCVGVLRIKEKGCLMDDTLFVANVEGIEFNGRPHDGKHSTDYYFMLEAVDFSDEGLPVLRGTGIPRLMDGKHRGWLHAATGDMAVKLAYMPAYAQK